MGAGLQRHVGRRAGSPCPKLGGAMPLRLASLHVQPPAEALAAPDHTADACALGCERWNRAAVLRTGLQRLDPRRALRAHRRGGTPSGDRAARGLRRPCRGVLGTLVTREAWKEEAMDVWYHNENPYPFVPQEVLD